MSNIKVAVRIRPFLDSELNGPNCPSRPIIHLESSNVVSVINDKVGVFSTNSINKRTRYFSFQHCFGAETGQDEVYNAIGKEVICSIFQKYNACVFAYGQSSTGKTYTMTGSEENPGLTGRICDALFKEVVAREATNYTVRLSFLEIYNERVRDLLSPNGKPTTLKVREHPKTGPYVQGLTEQDANDTCHLKALIERGNRLRHVASTYTNKYSSRSHSVIIISLRTANPEFNHHASTRQSTKLYLIDLAGSERSNAVSKSLLQIQEGANINKSLVALGNVINALSDSKTRTYVGYRDSTLTWLLRDILSGNSKTYLIATVSPASNCYNETVNTLRFGQKAQKIATKPRVNENVHVQTITQLRNEILELQSVLEQLKIERLRTVGTVDDGVNEEKNDQSTQTLMSEQVTIDNEVQTDNQTLMSEQVTIDSQVQTDHIHGQTSNENDQNKIDGETQTLDFSANDHFEDKPIQIETKNRDESSQTEQTSQTTNQKPDEAFENVSIPSNNRKLTRQLSLADVSSSSDPVKSAIKKHKLEKRSEIVASVTERLYGSLKKKPVEEPFDLRRSSSSSFTSEFTSKPNIRMRLKELSMRALNNKKNMKKFTDGHAQTEPYFRTVRMKDVETDSWDLPKSMSVRDQCVGSEVIMIDRGNSTNLNSFNKISCTLDALKLRKSCGNVTNFPNVQPVFPMITNKPQKSISFTKYINQDPVRRHPTKQNLSFFYSKPSFAAKEASFNINFNLIDKKLEKIDDSISDDSLDSERKSCLKPDLICSNSLKVKQAEIIHVKPEHVKNMKKIENKRVRCVESGEENTRFSAVKCRIKSYFDQKTIKTHQASQIRTIMDRGLDYLTIRKDLSNVKNWSLTKQQIKFLNQFTPKIDCESTSNKCELLPKVNLVLQRTETLTSTLDGISSHVNALQVKLDEIIDQNLTSTFEPVFDDEEMDNVEKHIAHDHTHVKCCESKNSSNYGSQAEIEEVLFNKYEQPLMETCEELQRILFRCSLSDKVNPSKYKLPGKWNRYSSDSSSSHHSRYGSVRKSPRQYLRELCLERRKVVDQTRFMCD